jgi:uncharacterized protein YoxC
MNKRENTIKGPGEQKIERQPQVACAMDKLAKAIDVQLMMLNELDKKLQPVLSEPMKTMDDSVEKVEELVPLALMIKGLAGRVEAQNQRLRELTERVEV